MHKNGKSLVWLINFSCGRWTMTTGTHPLDIRFKPNTQTNSQTAAT